VQNLCKYFKRKEISRKKAILKTRILWLNGFYDDKIYIIIGGKILSVLGKWVTFKLERLTPQSNLYDCFHMDDPIVQACVITDIEEKFNIHLPDDLTYVNSFHDLLLVVVKNLESLDPVLKK
jgi:hypothetical protein